MSAIHNKGIYMSFDCHSCENVLMIPSVGYLSDSNFDFPQYFFNTHIRAWGAVEK